jgi:hypothetical protein
MVEGHYDGCMKQQMQHALPATIDPAHATWAVIWPLLG